MADIYQLLPAIGRSYERMIPPSMTQLAGALTLRRWLAIGEGLGWPGLQLRMRSRGLDLAQEWSTDHPGVPQLLPAATVVELRGAILVPRALHYSGQAAVRILVDVIAAEPALAEAV